MVLSQALCTSSTHPRPARYTTDQRRNDLLKRLSVRKSSRCLSSGAYFRQNCMQACKLIPETQGEKQFCQYTMAVLKFLP